MCVFDSLGNGCQGVFVCAILHCRLENVNSEFVGFFSMSIIFWYLYIICFVFIPILKLKLAFLQRAQLFLYDMQHLIFFNIVCSV